jgi:hypothetical protein
MEVILEFFHAFVSTGVLSEINSPFGVDANAPKNEIHEEPERIIVCELSRKQFCARFQNRFRDLGPRSRGPCHGQHCERYFSLSQAGHSYSLCYGPVRKCSQRTDPIRKHPTDPSTRPPTDPNTRYSIDPGVMHPIDSSTKHPTDPSTRDPTDPGTKHQIDPSTKHPIDPNTRHPIDPSTRHPTDPNTRHPTDPGTKHPIDPSTRYPTDHSKKQLSKERCCGGATFEFRHGTPYRRE